MPHLSRTSASDVRARQQDRTEHWVRCLRRKLERHREFRREQLAALAAPGSDARSAAVDEHAKNPAMFEVASMVTGGAKEALAKIEEALTSMADGSYGFCRACDGDIPLALLEAIPETVLCLDCQRSFRPGPERTAPDRPADRHGHSGGPTKLPRRRHHGL